MSEIVRKEIKNIPTSCKFFDADSNACKIEMDSGDYSGCDNSEECRSGCEVFQSIEYAYIKGHNDGEKYKPKQTDLLDYYLHWTTQQKENDEMLKALNIDPGEPVYSHDFSPDEFIKSIHINKKLYNIKTIDFVIDKLKMKLHLTVEGLDCDLKIGIVEVENNPELKMNMDLYEIERDSNKSTTKLKMRYLELENETYSAEIVSKCELKKVDSGKI